MYKIVYFSGKELLMGEGYKLKTLVSQIAEKNTNVYQIVYNNRDQRVVWEREAE